MSNKKIVFKVLNKYLPVEIRKENEFMKKYDEISKMSLDSIGIDSFDFMNVLLEIEKTTGKCIEWTKYEPSDFNSIKKIEKYIRGIL